MPIYHQNIDAHTLGSVNMLVEQLYLIYVPTKVAQKVLYLAKLPLDAYIGIWRQQPKSSCHWE